MLKQLNYMTLIGAYSTMHLVHTNCDPLWKNRPFARKYDFAGEGSNVARTFFFQFLFLVIL